MTCTTGYFLLTANYPSSMLEGLCGLEFRIRVQSLPSGLSSILPAHINQERASILVCRTTLSIIISCIHCLLCTRSGTNLSWLRGECAFYNAKPANCIVKTHARTHTLCNRSEYSGMGARQQSSWQISCVDYLRLQKYCGHISFR